MIIWVISDSFSWEIINRYFVSHSKLHRFFLVSTSHKKRYGLVKFSLSLKIGSRLHHNWFARLQTHGHNFLIVTIFLCQSNSVVQSLGFRVINDGISCVILRLIVPCQMETSLRIISF